jgi:hypothetical protein
MRRLCVSLAALAIAGAAPAAAAAKGIYSQVLQAYQANGQVPPCQFTSAQLDAALNGVDTYGQQYFADFTDAIQSALAARASGACLPASGQSGQRRALNRAATAPAPFVPPSVTGSTSANLPAAIVVLALLTVVLGGGAGLAALASRQSGGLTWLATARHAAGETGYRLADWWDQRVGRGASGEDHGRSGRRGPTPPRR